MKLNLETPDCVLDIVRGIGEIGLDVVAAAITAAAIMHQEFVCANSWCKSRTCWCKLALSRFDYELANE